MNSHAFSVYFPVGLLTASVIFDVVAHATHRDELATAGWWTLVAGMIFAIIATLTGVLGQSAAATASPAGRSAVDIHGALAYVATILFGVLAVWRLVRRGSIGERWVPAYLATAVIAGSLLLATSYLGMRSVYAHAVGISDSTLEAALGVRHAQQGVQTAPEANVSAERGISPADTASEIPLPVEPERVDTIST